MAFEATNPILVIDDDVELCDLVTQFLAPEGFSVACVHDGLSGLERALSGDYRFVVLDVMLPGLGGFETLRRIRAGSQVPVLMLTARGSEIDRVLGLEIGADDYLPKPFNPRELVARIRAIQRRTALEASSVQTRLLQIEDIVLDLDTHVARKAGKIVDLTAVEFSLLVTLLGAAGRVVTRQDLAKAALGRRLTRYDRSIDTHVSNLRRKLGHEVAGVERIQAIRGIGYFYAKSARGGL